LAESARGIREKNVKRRGMSEKRVKAVESGDLLLGKIHISSIISILLCFLCGLWRESCGGIGICGPENEGGVFNRLSSLGELSPLKNFQNGWRVIYLI